MISDNASLIEYLVTNHRWFFCLFFLLPLSAAFEVYLHACSTLTFFTRKSAPAKHRQRVQEVQNQVKEWIATGCERMMCTGRPGWQAMSLRTGKYKRTHKNVRLDLHDILEVDTEKRTVRVEPMVTMGHLTRAINPLGWTLPVVPELDDLTVGGLIAGVGVETSSHRYGLFQHICTSFEVVLADGSVVDCSADERPELFYNVPWSHGTLGFVVSATIRMVPCKPYVKLSYVPYLNKNEAMARFDLEARRPQKDGGKGAADFVEMLAFSPSSYVVMLGTMVDARDVDRSKVNNIGAYYKPWFFTHVESFLRSGAADEFIPLRQYYHRHTRSLFWEIQDIIPFGNHWLFRYLMGWTMPPKPSLLKLTQTETLRQLYEKHHVVQDMLVPMRFLGESLDVFDREFYLYPLWLCPMRIPKTPGKHGGLIKPLPDGDDMFVDIGGYGNPVVKTFSARESCRRVEDHVRAKSGYQMMYADTYMTREEFRQMFDHAEYDKLRQKLPLTTKAFPEVYDKVCKSNRI